MMNRPRITMKEVAARCGVSQPIVSVVLSGRTDGTVAVGEPTRQRVLETARAMGYRPNLTAKGLREQRSYLVGVMLSAVNAGLIPDLLNGVQLSLASHNVAPLVFVHRTQEEERRHLQCALDRHVDGLLANPSLTRSTSRPLCAYKAAAASGLPIVEFFGSSLDGCPAVGFDSLADGRTATRFLLDRGHRRILLLTHDCHDLDKSENGRYHDAWRQRQGYEAEMRNAGLPTAVATFPMGDEFQTDAWTDVTREQAATVVNHPMRPTAVCCNSDAAALGLLQGCAHLGIRVPRDLSIIGYGDRQFGNLVEPSLCSVHPPAFDVGRLAADSLLARIDTAASASSASVPSTLIVRDSVCEPRSDQLPT